MLEEEYDKDHRAWYIEEGQVTMIVVFLFTNIASRCVEA
jgi:hypothetical protein